MDSLSGKTTTNNPSMDLLHGGGQNSQVPIPQPSAIVAPVATPDVAADAPSGSGPAQPAAPTPVADNMFRLKAPDQITQVQQQAAVDARDAAIDMKTTKDSLSNQGLSQSPGAPLPSPVRSNEPLVIESTQPAVMPSLAAAAAEGARTTKQAQYKPLPAAAPKPVAQIAPQPIPEPRPAPTPPAKGGGGKRLIVILALVFILLGAAVAAWWYLTQRASTETSEAPAAAVEVQAVQPQNLQLTDSSGALVDAGKATKQGQVTFKFTVPTKGNRGSLVPEVEALPVGTAFTGTPTFTGKAVSASGRPMELAVPSGTLTDASYHWQARVSKDGKSSEWAQFGTAGGTDVAFVIDSTPAATPVLATVGGKPASGKIIISANRPVFAGTADPKAVITATVGPENLVFTASANDAGAWSLQPDKDIPNGAHQITLAAADAAGNSSPPVSLALSINPATAEAAPATPAPSTPAPTPAPVASAATPAPGATPATTPAPVAAAEQGVKPATTLAPTGDATTTYSLIGLIVIIAAGGGLLALYRRDALL